MPSYSDSPPVPAELMWLEFASTPVDECALKPVVAEIFAIGYGLPETHESCRRARRCVAHLHGAWRKMTEAS
jgi:hypothetical protein